MTGDGTIRQMCNDIYEGESWQPMIDLIEEKDKEIERLKNIISKVIKYIKDNMVYDNNELWLLNEELDKLFEILRGENK